MELSRIQVLLVEDSDEYISLLREMFKVPTDQVFQLKVTRSVEEASRVISDEYLDLVLLDLNLPDSRGLSTFSRISAQAPHLPIVILSGLDDREMVLQAIRGGAQDYLIKPEVTPALLQRAMSHAIERKRIEETLSQERNYLFSLMEHIPDQIYFKDRQSRFLKINRQMSEWLGLKSQSDAIGRSDFDFFTKEHAEQAFEDEQEIIRSGKPMVDLEEKETWPDGRETWVSTTKVPFHDASEKIVGTFGISRDITERKRAVELLKKTNQDLKRNEEELRKTLEDLRAAQMELIQIEKMQSVGVLSAGVAHEVKNPLAVIQAGVDFLSHVTGREQEAQWGVIQDIREAVQRADNIIKGLLDFSSNRELHLTFHDLRQIVDDALGLIRHEIHRTKVKVSKEFPERCCGVMVDPTRIEQVLVNLMLNALHAMPRGGELHVQLAQARMRKEKDIVGGRSTRIMRKGDPVIQIRISDTGTGIPRELMGKLFTPFFTTKATGEGTGLGLTVSRKIVDLHGGRIEIKNRKEGGVSVTILLKEEVVHES